MPLNQNQIKNAITNFLPELGFRTTNLRSTGKNNGNLRAVHKNYERYFVIETTGDFTKNNKNTRNNSFSNRECCFYQALGQILTRMHNGRGYFYGLAFPDTFKTFAYRHLDSTILKQLNLNLFFVNSKGNVEYVTSKNFARKAA